MEMYGFQQQAGKLEWELAAVAARQQQVAGARAQSCARLAALQDAVAVAEREHSEAHTKVQASPL